MVREFLQKLRIWFYNFIDKLDENNNIKEDLKNIATIVAVSATVSTTLLLWTVILTTMLPCLQKIANDILLLFFS